MPDRATAPVCDAALRSSRWSDEEPALAGDPRQALKDELWGMGVSDEQSEAWILRWEAEASRRGLTPDDPAYWPQALAWIDETRGD